MADISSLETSILDKIPTYVRAAELFPCFFHGFFFFFFYANMIMIKNIAICHNTAEQAHSVDSKDSA